MNMRPADQLIERQALDGRMHQAFSGQQPGAPRSFGARIATKIVASSRVDPLVQNDTCEYR
jgi:hypothetical protein